MDTLIKCFDDCLGSHRLRGGMVDQLPGSAEEPQYCQGGIPRLTPLRLTP